MYCIVLYYSSDAGIHIISQLLILHNVEQLYGAPNTTELLGMACDFTQPASEKPILQFNKLMEPMQSQLIQSRKSAHIWGLTTTKTYVIEVLVPFKQQSRQIIRKINTPECLRADTSISCSERCTVIASIKNCNFCIWASTSYRSTWPGLRLLGPRTPVSHLQNCKNSANNCWPSDCPT